ncbi:class I SAM-dependent methyltransferase [Aestuariibacter sp. A3R04]|uniref:class I SAM-dependent methyltransferase n=1 Tax=Aestuariibacter sp. A3R04 TaxID=2841571 RepID=UPI001C08FC70|nr:class I SAM-dependent methyltransferase [Aestuariibacter sp. A3R04]MBU3023703.1 class I SAM-dependent methyltransferase [Aestuariibacter sp. A3R04]
MATPDIPVIIPANGDNAEMELLCAVADKWQFPIQEAPTEGLAITAENGKVAVRDFAVPKQQGVYVDFLSGSSQYRQQHGGGKKEPIAKAVGLKGKDGLKILDATPGLGRDAFVLVALGCEVTLVERSAVVAALLEDGIRRLANASADLAARMLLVHGNSIEQMKAGDLAVDVVYLDPMFPHKRKSALVKKEMRLFQHLLGADTDADELLAPARAVASQRVVVKRPAYAEPLASVAPSMAITSKKHRFDVYITPNQ